MTTTNDTAKNEETLFSTFLESIPPGEKRTISDLLKNYVRPSSTKPRSDLLQRSNYTVQTQHATGSGFSKKKSPISNTSGKYSSGERFLFHLHLL